MGNFKGWEILVILVLLLVLFGAKRLPDAARGLGRSLRIFKAEVKEMREDDDKAQSTPTTPPTLESRPSTTGEATARAPEPEARER
jgi:sec-independent protein translocase protein TatA